MTDKQKCNIRISQKSYDYLTDLKYKLRKSRNDRSTGYDDTVAWMIQRLEEMGVEPV